MKGVDYMRLSLEENKIEIKQIAAVHTAVIDPEVVSSLLDPLEPAPL